MNSQRTTLLAMLALLGTAACGPSNREAGYLVLLVWPAVLLLSLVPQRIVVALWHRARPAIETRLGRVLAVFVIAALVSGAVLIGKTEERSADLAVLALWLFGTSYTTVVLVATRAWLCHPSGVPSALFGPQLATSAVYAVLAALFHAGFADGLDKRWQDLFVLPGYQGWLTGAVFVLLCSEALVRRWRWRKMKR